VEHPAAAGCGPVRRGTRQRISPGSSRLALRGFHASPSLLGGYPSRISEAGPVFSSVPAGGATHGQGMQLETLGVTQMCDYSLEMYASRPARESEKYVTTRFPSGSIGLASPGDCTTAVCVQYDTHLKLEGISSDLQTRLGVKDEEQVIFARLEHGAYRDGIKFGNGKEISLQLLGSGVGAKLVATAEKPQSNRERRVVLETVE
jgi:hypothetical protein